MQAQQIFIHPQYVDTSIFQGYDIALIKLAQPVTTITPIQLVSKADTINAYQTNAPVKCAGWGFEEDWMMSFTGADTMRWVTSKVFDFNLCTQTMNFPISNKTFCVGYKTGETPGGAAAGDSGGPGWRTNGANDELIGIITGGSSAITAADSPGVFTKVAYARDWITSVIGAPTNISESKIADYNIKLGMSSNQLKIYFSENLSGNHRVELVDISGKIVLSELINLNVQRSHELNIGHFPLGLYVVKITNDSGSYFARKVLKY